MNIAVIGNGGHSKVIRELVHEQHDATVKAVLDDRFESVELRDGIYTGPIDSAALMMEYFEDLAFVIAIGDNRARRVVTERLALSKELYTPPLIHPRASVSPKATIGRGTVIMAGAIVQADVNIGNHAIINTSAVVEHDSTVECFAHIAPSAVLTGNVHVQKGAFVGAGTVVIPGKKVGEWATVGAGATVVRDIPEYSTAVGTPAKVISFYKLGDEANVTRNHA